MKTLYLLRHAKSSWDIENQPDLERPLNKRGRKNAISIGKYMRFHDLQPQLILCSPAQRCRETVDLIHAHLGTPPILQEPYLYSEGKNEVLQHIMQTKSEIDHLMVVGHNPTTADLALMLTNGANPVLREEMMAKYPTGTLAVIKYDCPHWDELQPYEGYLQRLIKPRLLP
ncbi:MAG: phosphohistidine phosphatase [Kordiimonas sp.]|nr:phosphohistidine phosphatase [Kordiimonas sp.]|tara:strand:- start:3169 stop:3681 length:513 start_codon:yes stop_codon:yes gene_type:complete